MPTKTYGHMIRRLREAEGWTAAELAERCGVKAPMLSKIENGVLAGSPKTRLAIARCLGVSTADITYFVKPAQRGKAAA